MYVRPSKVRRRITDLGGGGLESTGAGGFTIRIIYVIHFKLTTKSTF